MGENYLYKKNSDVIKSYGDNPNDYQFRNPLGITMDHNGNIYVADTGNKRVVKLWYDPSANQIYFNAILTIPNLKNPRDIIYTRASLGMPNRLWILDGPGGPLIITDEFGQVLNVVNEYTYQGLVYNFHNPTRMVCNKGDDMLYILDPSLKILIRGYVDYVGSDNFLFVVQLTQFPQYSMPTDVGLNCFDEPLVTDSYYSCIHKFSVEGDYICSFKFSNYNNPPFNYPKRFSNLSMNKPGWIILDNYMTDGWSANYGIKRYLAGSDIWDLTYQQFPNFIHRFSFLASDQSYVKIEIIKNNSVIKNLEKIVYAGSNIIYFAYNEIPLTTNLKCRVYYKPYYDNNYGSYQQGWKYKEIVFSTLFTPVISGFTQTPIPICAGTTGTVRCNLSQGNGNITYSWSFTDKPDYVSVRFSGNIAYVTNYGNSGGENEPKLENKEMLRPPFALHCTVTNEGGSSTSRYFPYLSNCGSGGGGCPFVYVYNGSEYVEDNNILPQSEYTAKENGFVTDYYQLFKKPVATDNTYKLRVAEFEEEISQLDKLSLIIVDHEPEASIGVSETGEISQYAKPASIANAQLEDEDVYKLVYELDNNYVEVQPDETLQLNFEGHQTEVGKALLISAVLPPPGEAKKLIAGIVQQNIEAKMINTYQFRLRRNPSFIWIPVEDVQSKEGNLEIGITWQQKANVDFTELSHKLDLPYSVYECELINAEHSVTGDVSVQLSESDNEIVELSPGEWVDLVFDAPELAEGKKRSFIFVSNGRYERIEKLKEGLSLKKQKSKENNERVIPKEFSLFQNKPNPFNPITSINFSLPVPGHTTLKIYDVLGREVAVLVNEFKDAGVYEVIWDASSQPSGVYFYKMQSGNFVAVKKMLLLR